MPTYVFGCQQCGQEFEVKLSWREKSKAVCPECGGTELKELLGRYVPGVRSRSAGSESVPASCRSCESPGPT